LLNPQNIIYTLKLKYGRGRISVETKAKRVIIFLMGRLGETELKKRVPADRIMR
jgi:hypothetical protein